MGGDPMASAQTQIAKARALRPNSKLTPWMYLCTCLLLCAYVVSHPLYCLPPNPIREQQLRCPILTSQEEGSKGWQELTWMV